MLPNLPYNFINCTAASLIYSVADSTTEEVWETRVHREKIDCIDLTSLYKTFDTQQVFPD